MGLSTGTWMESKGFSITASSRIPDKRRELRPRRTIGEPVVDVGGRSRSRSLRIARVRGGSGAEGAFFMSAPGAGSQMIISMSERRQTNVVDDTYRSLGPCQPRLARWRLSDRQEQPVPIPQSVPRAVDSLCPSQRHQLWISSLL